MSGTVAFDCRNSELRGRMIRVPAEGFAALIELLETCSDIPRLVAANGMPRSPFHALVMGTLRDVGCLNGVDKPALVDLNKFLGSSFDPKKTTEMAEDHKNAVERARAWHPDHPWPEDPTVAYATWIMGTAYDGVVQANDDLHAALDKFLEVCGPVVEKLGDVAELPSTRYVVPAGGAGAICCLKDLRALADLVRHWKGKKNPPVTMNELLAWMKGAVKELEMEDVSLPGLERLLERAETNGQLPGKEAGDGKTKKG